MGFKVEILNTKSNRVMKSFANLTGKAMKAKVDELLLEDRWYRNHRSIYVEKYKGNDPDWPIGCMVWRYSWHAKCFYKLPEVEKQRWLEQNADEQ